MKEKEFDCEDSPMDESKKIVSLLNSLFNLDQMAEEYIYMVALNTKGRPIGIFEVAHGTVDSAVCSTREIYMRALLCGATSIVLAHNHPSGNPTPSKQDLEFAERAFKAGELIGVKMLDNLVIGESGTFVSFLSNSLLPK